MKKKYFLIAVMLALSLALYGCAGGVEITSYPDGDKLESKIEVSIDEDFASAKGITPSSYSAYVEMLMAVFGVEVTSSAKFDIVGKRTEELAEKSSTVLTEDNFFVRTMRVEVDNPYFGVREKYEATAYTYVKGDNSTLNIDKSVGAILKNGWFGVADGVQIMVKPLKVEFPLISDSDIDECMLRYFFAGSNRMLSTGSKVLIDGKTWFRWEQKFDDTVAKVEYVYYRINTYGWIIVALSGGLMVTGAILLVDNIKRRRERDENNKLDIYPYDPEKEEGGKSNLPTSKK